MKENTVTAVNEQVFLGEEDYRGKMVQIVRPLLDKARKTGYYKSFYGARIYYEAYIHPQERAAIVISHGFCEFAKKFEEVIFYFYQAGYTVYIPEHRGHGYSKRSVKDHGKVHICSYQDYVLDLHGFITEVVSKDRIHGKLVLYAHSMGGAVAALYLEQYTEVFSGAVLSSPMLEIDFGKTPVFLIWLMLLFKKLIGLEEDYVAGHHAFDGIPHFETSSCLSEARYQEIFEKRLQDTNYQTYGASCAWTLASLRAVRKLQRHARQVKTPVLLLQAGKDTTVKSGGQKRFAEKSQNTRIVLIPDSKHEIYNAHTAVRKDYYDLIFGFLKEIAGEDSAVFY